MVLRLLPRGSGEGALPSRLCLWARTRAPTFLHGQRPRFPKRRSKCSRILPCTSHRTWLVRPWSPWQAGVAPGLPSARGHCDRPLLGLPNSRCGPLIPRATLTAFPFGSVSPVGGRASDATGARSVFCLGPYRVLLFGECCRASKRMNQECENPGAALEISVFSERCSLFPPSSLVPSTP